VDRSNFACLNMDQFTTLRFEEAKDEVKFDAWQPIYDWISVSRNDPQKISAGLNSTQFLDALGVCVSLWCILLLKLV
jgi:hypothetical protein